MQLNSQKNQNNERNLLNAKRTKYFMEAIITKRAKHKNARLFMTNFQ